MKSAFVTGATGFVGRNLVEQLVEQGWGVTALHRPASAIRYLQGFGVLLAAGDLQDLPSLHTAIPKDVSAVFHVAGNTSVWSRHNDAQYRDNVDGTRNMVEAALHAGAKRFVHTSTWNTYGLDYDTISEDTPQRGLDSWINYNRTKTLAELEIRKGIEHGLQAVIINPAHVVGRYDPGNWSRMILMVHHGRLPGIPPGAGTFCHAEQVALAHIAAAERGKVGDNYLLPGTDASFAEVIRLISDLTGQPAPRHVLAPWALRLVGRVHVLRARFTGRPPDLTPEAAAFLSAHPRIVSDRAQRELGYRRVPLRTMFEDCYRWMVSEGLLSGT